MTRLNEHTEKDPLLALATIAGDAMTDLELDEAMLGLAAMVEADVIAESQASDAMRQRMKQANSQLLDTLEMQICANLGMDDKQSSLIVEIPAHADLSDLGDPFDYFTTLYNVSFEEGKPEFPFLAGLLPDRYVKVIFNDVEPLVRTVAMPKVKDFDGGILDFERAIEADFQKALSESPGYKKEAYTANYNPAAFERAAETDFQRAMSENVEREKASKTAPFNLEDELLKEFERYDHQPPDARMSATDMMEFELTGEAVR